MHRLNVFVLGTRGVPGIQGGVEKHCEELYPILARSGCKVFVATRTPYVPREKRYKRWRGVNLIHVWCPRQRSLEAITHSLLALMVAKIKSTDILHIHSIGPALVTPVARLLGFNIVTTNHGPDYKRQKWGFLAKKILRIGEFLGIKFSDKVIVISKNIKESLEKKYGRKDLIFIPNGVRIVNYVSSSNILDDLNLIPRKYIFTACRFVPEKGLHDLISAYKSIKNPEFKLVIAGDADHETEYSRDLKKSVESSRNIVMTGFLSGSLLEELYANAGLFVLPSYYEGLPIALLEAMSYGLPVLVSDIPQHREINLPEFRYFPVKNVEKLAEKMIELINKGISREEQESQLRILEDNYNWEIIAKKTLAVYESCLR